MNRCVLPLTLALSVVACGGKTSTPTSSTPPATTTTAPPTAAPPPVPPAPAPVPPTLTFAVETTNPMGNSYTVDAALGVPGEITIRMNAFSFAPGRPVHKVRATLLYDPAILMPADNFYSQGPWMLTGGALTTFDIRSGTPGRLTISIDRPDNVSGVTGSGTIISKRFLSVSGVRNRSTPLQWTDTDAYTVAFAQALTRAYGGFVSVQ